MWFVSKKKYKRLLEENEDLKNLYNFIRGRFECNKFEKSKVR